MAIYNIHAGHGLSSGKGCGAVGILDESTEARKVKTELIRLLRETGNTVYDCTYEGNADQNTILAAIVKNCNKHDVNLDISIHLNSGRNDYAGDGSTGGVEVYGYDNDVKEIGNKICSNVANTLGIRNRGFKSTKSLYVLNNTKSKAILVECCFVDDKDDTNRWDALKCATAICAALGYNLCKDSTISNTHKYSVGQYVVFGTSYPSSTTPCGITYATSGSGQGKITAIKEGQAKYEIDNGKCYINDGDIQSTYTPENSNLAHSAVSNAIPNISTSNQKLTANTHYRVFANDKWYSEVKNLDDYAGDGKNAIRGIAIKVDNGSVKYRVHTRNGNWYPYVTGYNTADVNNGYAGDCKNDIDAVEVYFSTPSGYSYKKAKYRLAPLGNTSYYGWQTDNDKGNGMDGYAGQFGISFGKFQIVIE